MLDVESIIDQVSGNCAVSDARSAGLYSICGLALRLRDLFKWEKGGGKAAGDLYRHRGIPKAKGPEHRKEGEH